MSLETPFTRKQNLALQVTLPSVTAPPDDDDVDDDGDDDDDDDGGGGDVISRHLSTRAKLRSRLAADHETLSWLRAPPRERRSNFLTKTTLVSATFELQPSETIAGY